MVLVEPFDPPVAVGPLVAEFRFAAFPADAVGDRLSPAVVDPAVGDDAVDDDGIAFLWRDVELLSVVGTVDGVHQVRGDLTAGGLGVVVHQVVEDLDADPGGEATVVFEVGTPLFRLADSETIEVRRLPEDIDGVSDVEVVRAGGPRAAVMPSRVDETEEIEESKDSDPPF